MKIVEEPSNYGLNNYQFGNSIQNDDVKLKMRIKPSNFSGPLHFKRFVGNCFKKEIDSYKYELCPFYNVTQREMTYRWNPFHGVLGVWQEWEISNNTFVTMVMREGEKCGNIYRTVKVKFKCGEKHEILNVTEPSTCNYEMWFSTPFVCHKLSMLVYPTLSESLQSEWDSIERDLYTKDITQKGYDKRLRKLFEKAGYYLSKATQEQISASAIQKEETEEKEEKGEFESLGKCTEEYKKLKKEIEGLRTVLALKDSKEGMRHKPSHNLE
ncbi:hypothetical protein FSP39_018038 [Pinctada imbricata]|uniref:MRH domain-containing protein n=1 Tax=Pinctada imbricata TaxID=66713 RepID=A0AA88XSU3_PINIB|nr:hypothetical protein FSP39_018038 [Pinctada imbricata]